jgi:AcrR family transcriptional regulator
MSPTALSRPNPRGRGADREETRRRLVVAARAVFAERGYGGATIDEICARAKFTRGAFYSNFADKEDIMLAVTVDQREQEDPAIQAAVRGDRPEQTLRGPNTAKEGRQLNMLNIEFVLHCMRQPRIMRRARPIAFRRREGLARALEDLAKERGVDLPLPSADLARMFLALNAGQFIEGEIDPDGHAERVERVLMFLFDAVFGERPTRSGAPRA